MKQKLALIFTVGTAPAVITETIYAVKKEYNQVPNELHFLTTSKGRSGVLSFKQDYNHVWEALRASIGVSSHDLTIDDDKIYVAKTGNGEDVDDLMSTEANMLDAEMIHKVVGQLCNDTSLTIYASLAGGRKTMSSHLLSAMQLYGRQGDKVLHILLEQNYEGIQGFYFPGQPQLTNVDPNLRGNRVDPSNVSVSLIEVPFVKIGSLVEGIRTDLQLTSYSALIDKANEQIALMSKRPFQYATLDINSKILSFDYLGAPYNIRLSPKEFQWVLFHHLWNEYHDKEVPFQLYEIKLVPSLDTSKLAWLIVYEICYNVIKNNDLGIKEDFDDYAEDYSKQRTYLKNKLIDRGFKNPDIAINSTSSVGNYREMATTILEINPLRLIWNEKRRDNAFRRIGATDSDLERFILNVLKKSAKNDKKDNPIIKKHSDNLLENKDILLETVQIIKKALIPLFEE